MVEHISNDNHMADVGKSMRAADAHGQASILLIESLIHALVVRSIIDANDAVEIVGVAVEVIEDLVTETGDPLGTLTKSLTLLRSIRSSLTLDLPE